MGFKVGSATQALGGARVKRGDYIGGIANAGSSEGVRYNRVGGQILFCRNEREPPGLCEDIVERSLI